MEAVDPEGDYLVWSLENAPSGMAIDAVSGVLSWQPNPVNIGEHTIDVRVTDAGGLSAGQEFLLRVTGANTAPQIVSVPPTLAGVNEGYSYQAVATDLERDGFEFSLVGSPEGMTVDEVTGVVSWTPIEIGSYEVDLRVTDELGASSSQVYTIEVGEQRVNNAPEIASNPVYWATPDVSYSYQVVATDVDGDELSYELIAGPSGMAIDEVTGLVSWESPAIGSHQVVVGVNDGDLGAAQGYNLTVRNNSLPEIGFPDETQVAIPERLYRYDLQVTDAEGDALSFELVSGPDGMSIDDEGRISWFPDNEDVGDYSIEVKVTDSFAGESTGSFELRVTGDEESPVVELLQGFNFVYTGQQQVLWVAATDNVGVTSLGLVVDGEHVQVSPDGVAKISFDGPGEFVAIASAKDAAGNEGTATVTIEVLDPDDGEGPIVSLDALPQDLVTNVIQLTGTVSDDNLAGYQLEAAPIGTDNFVTIFEGTENVDGVLGVFDPTLLLNDTYTLRLTATDTGGISSFVEETIDVGGDLKLGNFQISFTDLEVPVSGIPISVTRTYDSLAVGTSDDFGPGWRLEFRDTDLRTSLGPDETFERFGIRENAFSNGTRVYLTLPGGKREAFTFSPTPDRLNGFITGPGGEGGWFHPSFTSQDGSFNTLTVEDVRLTRNPNGEYVGLNGVPYHPENPMFGGRYTLTTKEGIVYRIDASSGDLLTVTDRNGNTLRFTEEGIFSDTGKQVTFQRDARGRIERIFDPMGEEIVYDYDRLTGDLIGVTDREDNTTTFEYEEPTRVHFLTGIDDPLGRDVVRNEYDELGRLKRILDVNGEAVELVYDPDNSTQTVKDVFGYETFYEYDERGNIVQEIDPVGLKTVRTYDDDNNLLTETVITPETSPNGRTTEWTYDGNGNQLTKKDELGNITRWSYNQWGQMLTETDPLGQATSYFYDSRGNLMSSKDAADNETEYRYDGRGNLRFLIDAADNETEFRYDAFGNVEVVKDALGNEVSFSYNLNGDRTSETRTVTTPQGIEELVTVWTYDDEGRLKTITNAENEIVEYEYGANGKQTATVDALLRRTEYRYNDRGELVETIYPDDTPGDDSDNPRTIELYDRGGRRRATVNQLGQVTHYNYDERGRLIETIHPDETNSLSPLIDAIAPGTSPDEIDWTQITYPDETPAYLSDNPRSSTEYYRTGQTLANTDERGNRTEYRYDALGQLLQTVHPDDTPDDLEDNPRTRSQYDPAGRRIGQTDALGRRTTFIYDEIGRQTQTLYGDGTSASTVFDALGRRIAATDRGGRTTQYKYDALGRLTEIIHPDDTPENDADNPRTRNEYDELGRAIAFTDERDNRTEYEYDKVGRRTLVRDALLNETTYSYDAASNLSTSTDALNRTTEFIYDSLNRAIETHFEDETRTTVAYDDLGRPIAQTDEEDKTTLFEYDERGRLLAVVDAKLQRTEYSYDAAGNLIAVKDANNHITAYEYDERNRRTATILPELQRSETTYDAVGNAIGIKDFNQETITYRYDDNNRRIAKEFSDSTSVSYAYTPTGQMSAVTDSRGTTTYKYDARNRLLSRTDPDGPYLSGGVTIEYRYDAAGNRISVSTPGGTASYTYDKLNRLETAIASGEVTTYFYDDFGNLKRTEFPNQIVETRDYDLRDRLTFLKNVLVDPDTGAETAISSYEYTLDSVGNRRRVEENNGRAVEYDYDEVYRLMEERITDPSDPANDGRTISYTHDDVGNRLTRNDSVEGETTYSYNDNDWLLEEELNGAVTAYSYDDNGNTTRVINGSEETVYIWDKENRLVGVETPDGDAISYVYDADNIRVSATVNGATTDYLVDKNRNYAQVIEEYANDSLVASYVYGHDLISQQREGDRSFYLVDGLGSTRVLTDERGEVTDTYTYDAFGNRINSTGQMDNAYLFAGEQFDEHLDQYYLRQRYYDSNIGRFTRRDTYEGSLQEPITLHKYLYANADPVNFIDPSGYFSILSKVAALTIATNLAVTAISDLVFPLPLNTPTSAGDFGYGPSAWKAPFEIVLSFLAHAAVQSALQRAVVAGAAEAGEEGAKYLELLEGINPNYSGPPDPTAPGTWTSTNMNCFWCAVETDRRLATGVYEGIAQEVVNGQGVDLFSALDYLGVEQPASAASTAKLEEFMLNAGDSARAIIFGMRPDLPGGAAPIHHFFNAVNAEGVIYFLNGQAETYQDMSTFVEYYIIRTN